MQSQVPSPFLRIGTRGSPLALAQAHLVRRLLSAAHGVDEAEIAIHVMSTSGDRSQASNISLSEIGGKGVFTQELEAGLLAGELDLAVHSSKDIPTTLPDGLELPVFLEREDVRDAFVSLNAASIDDLPQGARLGTSSIRRAAQMLRHRPDLVIVPFRGNVDTRLQKLRDGIADATLLATAGLNRLGKQDQIGSYLDPQKFPPAPAQGAIGLELRSDDARTKALLAPLDHAPTSHTVHAERAFLKVLDGSCRTPIGAYSRIAGDTLTVLGQILSPDGTRCYTGEVSGRVTDGEKIGAALGEKLLTMAGPDFVTLFDR